MRNSLYDALEVNTSSSTDAIKAALRTVVRRFWAVPRDASGDSEEAVRFAALAASILVDPVRRKDYDAALNPSVGAGPWRLPIGRQPGDASNEGATNSRVLADQPIEVSQISIEAVAPKALPGVDALAEPLPDGKAWKSPIVWLAMLVAWLALWYALARPFPEWFNLSLVQALGVALGSGVLIYAVAAWLSRSRETPSAAAGLSRLAIIKWRREGSIFLGTPPPQHDTAWIFKLRLMELTRSAAGFVTSANPWRRLAARLIDYSLVAVVVYLLVAAIDEFVPALDELFVLLRSVVLLPTLVAVIAIPLSALFHRVFGNTPGKWLLSLHLVCGVTRPSDHSEPTDRQLLWRRATRVAWSGAALGFWPLALFRLPRNMQLARDTETEWEGSGDSLVMARPMTTQALATGLFILVASALILVSGWRRDYIAAWPQMVSAAMTLQGAATGLIPGGAESVTPATAASGTAASPAVPPGFEPRSAPAPAAAPAPSVPAAVPAKPAKPPKATATPPVPTAEAEMARLSGASQARRARIDGYARQAEAARRSGSYGGLQGSCQRWTQEEPGNGEAWRCLGLAQFQAGAGREALPALRQALKLEPRDAQVESAILSILRP